MNYTYLPGVDGSTTGLVKSTADGFDNVSYDYDNNGNIKTIIQNGQRIDYVYDALNQLTRENNKVLNKTIAYEYDAGGNIKSKKEFAYTTGTLPTTPLKETPYTYDASWKDLLVSYDGSTITYDTIGNPLSYRGLTMTWEHGRQLKSITGNGKNISYKYNDSGIRTEKNVNGKVTKYHLVGSNVTYETSGTDRIYYYYNGSGMISGMQLNDTYYFFTKNAQGDVTGILDLQGNKVVTYTYDSWGNIVGVTDTSGIGLATKNPYRYRGYRYDEETGLFYVGSRYYDPEIGRWISPEPNVDSGEFDEGSEILGYNVYAYCFNNPVNNFDPDGEAVANIVGGVIGGVAGAALGILLAKELGLSGWKKALFIAGVTAAGAALGAFLGPYMAKLGGKIASMTKTAAKTAVKKVVKSTGRTTAKNLAEQVFMKSVKSNPLKGAKHLKNIVLNDSQWLASKGWIKMEQVKKLSNGTSVVVHFVYNTITGKTGDFKFK